MRTLQPGLRAERTGGLCDLVNAPTKLDLSGSGTFFASHPPPKIKRTFLKKFARLIRKRVGEVEHTLCPCPDVLVGVYP